MKQEKPGKFKKYMVRGFTVVCAGIFVYAAYSLASIYMDYEQGRQVADDVQETFHETASAEKDAADQTDDEKPDGQDGDDKKPDINPKFDELLEENEDVAGWITIEDTKIDYPILKSEDNQDYLDQDFYHNDSIGGSIFLDYRNDIQSDDRNMIVYGHRMKDGSMFQHLTKFMEEDFFESHRTFEVETLYESYEAEIFAVYNTTTDFNYIKTDFADDEEYGQLLRNIENESRYQTDVEVDTDDRIITLSTCDYELDENEGRLVVQAKLKKDQ